MRYPRPFRRPPGLAGLLALTLSTTLYAHAISISYGDIKVDGSQVRYDVRMPAYEIPANADAAKVILSALALSSSGTAGDLKRSSCHQEANGNWVVCNFLYDFATPVRALHVECRLARATVPNHIHMLKAQRGSDHDKGVFDRSTESADLRFRPPTAFEAGGNAVAIAIVRTAAWWMGLALVALVGAGARSRAEFATMFLAFEAGEALTAITLPHTTFEPSTAFVSAAIIIAAAYLSFEIALLRTAAGRWAVCGALGLIAGMYYATLLRGSEVPASGILAGAFLVNAVIASVAFAATRAFMRLIRFGMPSWRTRPQPAAPHFRGRNGASFTQP